MGFKIEFKWGVELGVGKCPTLPTQTYLVGKSSGVSENTRKVENLEDPNSSSYTTCSPTQMMPPKPGIVALWDPMNFAVSRNTAKMSKKV